MWSLNNFKYIKTMKNFKLFKSLLVMLCMVLMGGGSVKAEPKTYQHVFNAKPKTGTGIPLTDVNWDIEAQNLGSYNSQSYAGVQVGTSSSTGYITLTSSGAWDFGGNTKITEVRLWLNKGRNAVVTPTVAIGGVSATSDGTEIIRNTNAGTDWTQASKVTFTPVAGSNSGVVVIKVDVTSKVAGYICALEIDCVTDGEAPSISSPTLSLPNGTYYGKQSLEIGVPEGASGVKYTLDETDPQASATAIRVSEQTTLVLNVNENVTIKAVAFDSEGNYSNVVSRTYTILPSIANTKETAYTTTEAIDKINDNNTSEAQLTAEKVYVKGVVSKVDSYNSTYKSITYWLDDNAFEVYSGKGLNNVDFSKVIDIEVGATVIVYGNIKKFGEIYELDKNNYLVEYTAPSKLDLVAQQGENYYATFSSEKDVKFVDAEVYAVNVEGDALKLNVVESKVVPANTGVLIKTTGVTTSYYEVETSETISKNMLKASTVTMSASDKNYKLAYNDYTNKTGLGFYYGAADGGVFTPKAGGAYLAVPSSLTHARCFTFDDVETGINTIEVADEANTAAEVYDLAGRKVSKAQKGLYIVNGVKVIK